VSDPPPMPTLSMSVKKDTEALANHPLKIVALGDSLVYGYGDPIGGGWAERLRRLWMGSDGPALYNLGIRGDRVLQVSERLEQEFRLRGEIRNRLPDKILLSVGVNDTARLGRLDGRTYTDMALFRTQIEQLLDRSRSLCPVYYVGMVPVDERKMPFLDCFYFNHLDQYRFKEITKEACLAREIPYLDLFDLWMARGDDWCRSCMMDDGLHPNVKGYQTILEDVLAWQAIASFAPKTTVIA
jgi:lysophospholipase L1-like esterase